MAKKAVKKAPAKKAAAKKTTATKTPVKKVAKKAVKKVAAKKAPAKKAPAKKAAAKKAAPAVSSAAAETVVIARCDLGFGNELFVRGDGPGLSWDVGTAMKNIGPDEWSWSAPTAKADFEVKFLTNDSDWSAGENLKVKAGSKAVFVPVFG